MTRFAPRSTLTAALLGTLSLAACSDDLATTVVPVGPTLNSSAVVSENSHLVVFETQSIPAGFAAKVVALGGTVDHAFERIGVAYVSGLSASAVSELDATAEVRNIEVERILALEEPTATALLAGVDPQPQSPAQPSQATYWGRQWNLRQIGADRAWAKGRLGSDKVTVGIIDTGLDYTHPDLTALVDLARSRSFLPAEDSVVAKYLPAGTHPVFDLQGHGTHVGSTVSSNGIVAAGVTSKVKLVGMKVCRSGIPGLTAGGCPNSATFAALMYAADSGVDVVNMSLGGLFTKSSSGGFEEVIHRVFNYAKEKKVTVVVSSGNSAVDIDHGIVPVTDPVTGVTTSVQYSSLYATYCNSTHVICVSATGPRSATNLYWGPWFDIDALASYSNFGREAIDVAAPGGTENVFVWAACPTYRVVRTATGYRGQADAYCRTTPTGKAGTSMAAPHVTGLAALMVERYGRNPSAVAEAVAKFSDDLGETGRDPKYGKGRINVARALGL